MATLSDTDNSDLDLQCSYSEVETISSELSESEDDHPARLPIAPYMFELYRSDSASSEVSDSNQDDDIDRLGNMDWCRCGHCTQMVTAEESRCCNEIQPIYDRVVVIDSNIKCITEHPGFRPVCLDVYSLETAYYQYRQQYGQGAKSNEERLRYTGYRQLVRWCWGWLGKQVRVPLPSCAVNKIRTQFQSETYKGFKFIDE